jgi:lipopolysaccharide assembly outer membrane protein LptD (OstA)
MDTVLPARPPNRHWPELPKPYFLVPTKRMFRWRSALILIGAVLGWASAGAAGPGGFAFAGAAPSLLVRGLDIAADEVTTDSAGRTLQARGHVQVAYGGILAKADQLHWDRPVGSAKLTGHVVVIEPQIRVTGDAVSLEVTGPGYRVVSAVVTGHAAFESPQYALAADEITADRLSGRLAARGHLTLFSAPDVIITGERGIYDQHAQYAVVTGGATAANKDGRLQGEWIELFRASGRAVVHGPVVAELYGATITGDQAAVTFRTSSAVFMGHVVITQRKETVWADRATLSYGDRRIVAEGTTRARLADMDSTTP